MFDPNILGKWKITKMIYMGSNVPQALNYIISNGPRCVLIISDDACDFQEMLKILKFRYAWRDFRAIFCQESASHPIRGSAEKVSNCSLLAAIPRRMHGISSDLIS